MAKIEKRISSSGCISYKVLIRRKGIEISKTFTNEEDANLYALYRERLIENKKNFDIPIEHRITIQNLLEMKMSKVSSKRELNQYKNIISKVSSIIGFKFVEKISFDDWIEFAKKLYKAPLSKGAGHNKYMMSPKTLRNHFAYMSSAFSDAIKEGINIENYPQRVIDFYIKPMMKN